MMATSENYMDNARSGVAVTPPQKDLLVRYASPISLEDHDGIIINSVIPAISILEGIETGT
jgi:hypothetical protein